MQDPVDRSIVDPLSPFVAEQAEIEIDTEKSKVLFASACGDSELARRVREETEEKLRRAWEAIPLDSPLRQSCFGRRCRRDDDVSFISTSDEASEKRYFNEIARVPLLTFEDERVLGYAMWLGDEDALMLLIEANLRFVVRRSTKLYNRRFSLPDLIQEGNIGLVIAAKRFDPDRGCRFLTFASNWIDQKIFLAIVNSRYFMRLPSKKSWYRFQIGAASAAFREEYRREPTVEDIASRVCLDVAEVRHLLQVTQEIVSLDGFANEEHDFLISQKIPQTTDLDPHEVLEKMEFARRIRSRLSILSRIEQEVIRLRYGIEGKGPLTLQQVGDRLRRSRERIRQIEATALRKLANDNELHELIDSG